MSFTKGTGNQSYQNNLASQQMLGYSLIALCVIQNEITIIWASYYENFGEKIENLGEEQPFLIHYPMGKNFFTIYRQQRLFNWLSCR